MIVGHQKQWQFLKKSAELKRIPHALLFSGQEQLGKKTLAREFVKFLNCEGDASKKPCQICRSCRDIQKGVHPDFILIEPGGISSSSVFASKKATALPSEAPEERRREGKGIQISQIRELIWKLSLRPYSASLKITIIDKAHLMNREAQNCFLKTLEEPKDRTLLILISEYPEMLLPTILSRVQKIRFFPVKKEEIENYLIATSPRSGQGVSQDRVEYFASLSLGRPGLAIDFFLNEQKLKNQEKLISDIAKIRSSDFGFRFQYAKNLLASPKTASLGGSQETFNIKEILNVWLRYFRELFISCLKENSGTKPSITFQRKVALGEYSLSKLKKIISLIQSTSYLTSTTNINPKLALEILLMEL